MKLGITTLLGLSQGAKLRFGQNDCEFGPSYWCENIQKSNQCSATDYCVQKEWNKPTAPDSICETCKTAVGLVHMYLTDNKTRAEVQDVLDYACEVIPSDNIKDDCYKLIHQEADIIFDFISEVTNPDIICSALQLCSAATEEDLVKAIELNIENLPKAQVQIQPEADEQLPPMAINIFHAENNAEQLQELENFEGTGCDICLMVVMKIDEALEDETKEGEVLDYAENACNILPDEYSDQCKAAIEMYGAQIIKMLEAQLDPKTICGSIGLCSAISKELPAACIQPKVLGMCRALMPRFFFNSVTNNCESFNFGGCGGNENNFETEEECRNTCVQALNLTPCEDCKLAVTYLRAFLSDPENTADLVQALEQVCDTVPGSFRDECQDMVDTYGTLIINHVDTLMDPNFMCEKMQLCSIAPKKQMLVGANPCTFGPSYWCANMENAKACKSVDHCVEKGLLEFPQA